MTKLVEQEHPWGCAIAATAMFLNKTYEEVYNDFKKPTEGYPIDKNAFYLWDNGHDVRWHDKEMPAKKIKAIVVVNSKNYTGKYHSIYYDGDNFFDPSKEKRYVDWLDVEKNIYGCLQNRKNYE